MSYKIWTEKDIREVLNEASQKANYNCSHIPIKISKRLITTGGYFEAKYEKNLFGKVIYKGGIKFSFSYYYLNGVLKEEDVRQLILHEYCHFLTIDKTKEHHDHDELFKKNCEIIGCNITSDKAMFKINEDVKKYKYTVNCSKCNNKFGVNRLEKKFTEKYCCNRCSNEFIISKNW